MAAGDIAPLVAKKLWMGFIRTLINKFYFVIMQKQKEKIFSYNADSKQVQGVIRILSKSYDG